MHASRAVGDLAVSGPFFRETGYVDGSHYKFGFMYLASCRVRCQQKTHTCFCTPSAEATCQRDQ